MAAEYRFLIADVLTDDVLAELPVEACTFSESLNTAGSLSATMRLGAPQHTDIPPSGVPTLVLLPGGVDNLGDTDGNTIALPYNVQAGAIGTAQGAAPSVLPGRHAIYVERDGVLLWGGVVWTYVADVATNVGSIGAEGFFSLVQGRVLDTDYTATGRDQVLIVKDLLDTIQAYPGGDMLLDTSDLVAQGTTRDRTYEADEWKDVGEAIEQLSAVRGGFDFRVGVGWSASGPLRRMLITSADGTGRPTEYVLELGRNLELLSLTVDATTLVSNVYAAGKDNLTALESTAIGFYPRRDMLINEDDISVPATLQDHALRALDRGAEPMAIPFVSIYPNQEPKLGSFITGDIVAIVGEYGAVDFSGDYRITAWQASIDTAGAEVINLTLAPTEVFHA